ncbi:hypothetical protein ACFQZI_13175 [Mucilaginibacter lutimaris]|uniref:BFN domain-containing protein n=1 Tax=Mucilaginibacter lutimaris TaxID=931629 RepID=A0ABW2ZI14_9SPHI
MKISYPFKIEDVKITLLKKLQYNKLPYFTITISGDGYVIYRGEYEKVTIQKSNIPVLDVFKLIKHAVYIGFFEMEENPNTATRLEFENGNVCNIAHRFEQASIPYSMIEITIGNQVKRCLYLNMPTYNRLTTFANRIIKYTDLKKIIDSEDEHFEIKKAFAEVLKF